MMGTVSFGRVFTLVHIHLTSDFFCHIVRICLNITPRDGKIHCRQPVIRFNSLGSVFTKVFHGILPSRLDRKIVRRVTHEKVAVWTQFPSKEAREKITNIFQ